MTDSLPDTGRRHFLRLATAGTAVGLTAPARLLARDQYPSSVGSKFYPNGQVRPFAGNSIICHLPQQGEHANAFDAMLDVYRDAPAHRFLRKVAVLPPSSYHMTIFDGANDHSRKPGGWPADLPPDLPVEACNRAMADRLGNFDLGIKLPIRMRVDPMQSPANGRAMIFRLQPVDDAENAKLRGLRDRIADVVRYRAPNHDKYQFHVSFGYPVAWFDDGEDRDFQRTWLRWAGQIARKCPEIVLGAPEYCTFEDMFAFHRQFYLGQSG